MLRPVDCGYSCLDRENVRAATPSQELPHPRTGGRFVVAREATGSGDSGPSIEERYGADEAATALRDRGFDVEREADRP